MAQAGVLEKPRVQLMRGLVCTKTKPTSLPAAPHQAIPVSFPEGRTATGGQLMHVLWRFVHEDRRLLGDDAHGHAEVDFSDMLDPAWIDAHIDDLRARGRRLPGS